MKLLKIAVACTAVSTFLFFLGFQVTSCSKSHSAPDTLSNGLVAWYSFNGGSLKDGSGNGNDIVSNNAVATSDRFGHANNAFLFNGTTSFMRVANSPSLNPSGVITMMAIIRINGFNTGSCHA